MRHLILTIVTSVAVCFFHSCANNKPVEEKVEEPVEKIDKLVARISSVNHGAEYVLIQRYGKLVIPDDSILYGLNRASEEGAQTSNLKLTGEKLGQFLAADIVSGNPSVGDAVYLRDLEQVVKKPGLTPNQANLDKLNQYKNNVSEDTRSVVNDSLNGVNKEDFIQDVKLLKPKEDDTLLPIVE